MAARKNYTAAQIINGLRRAEVGLANGKSMKEVIRDLGVSEQTYYRWRREYGGMKTSQAKRLKELEKENQRLKRAVADLTVDNMILKEASKGKLSKPRAAEALCGAGPAAARGEREASVRGVGPGSIDTTEESEGEGLMKRRYERTWSRWRVGSVATGTGWLQGC